MKQLLIIFLLLAMESANAQVQQRIPNNTVLCNSTGGAASPTACAAMGITPIGADPTGVADSTVSLQAWIVACETSSLSGGGLWCFLPAGTYKITNTLFFSQQIVNIRGAGPLAAIITMTGVAKPFFQVRGTVQYWQPVIEDIGLRGDAVSGYGFDLSLVTGQVYHFSFKNIDTYTGSAAIYAINIFAGSFENWTASSYSDSVFKVACGPGVVFIQTYAAQVPTGRAGYRLSGSINMQSPNGINSGDFWAVFGNNSIYGLTLTTPPVNAATSATLTPAFAGTTGSYQMTFNDGEQRIVTLTNGQTTVSWAGGLANTGIAFTAAVNVTSYSVTFTGAPVATATSATLTSNFVGPSSSSANPYTIFFSDGEARIAQLTNGSTAVTWTTGLANTVTVAGLVNDGWQNDFPTVGASYPSIQLYNANVESANVSGIVTENPFSYFEFRGGGFSRSGLSNNYHSMLRIKQGALAPNSGIPAPVHLSPAYFNIGSGSPIVAGGYIYSDVGIQFFDEGAGLGLANNGVGIDYSYSVPYGTTLPFPRLQLVADVYASTALNFSAVYPQRLTVGTLRYAVPAVLTPVGAAQAIAVTGSTRVTVTPASAASITTATFNTAIDSDNGRNGDLIIEAGNNNLTINHSASGANTFYLAAQQNLTLYSGQIVRFVYSTINNNWVQTGVSSNGGATITGAPVAINASSNFATNIGTGSTTSAVTLGGGSNAVTMNATTLTLGGTTLVTSTSPVTLSNAAIRLTGLASSSAPTTGTVCWSSGATNLTVDTTVACLSSTKRVKQNIKPIDVGLNEVMKLRPVSYDLKPEFNPMGLGPMVGLVAEETQAIDPRLVSTDDKGTPLGVRYMQFTAVLVKAIQEQQAEIANLKREIRHVRSERRP